METGERSAVPCFGSRRLWKRATNDALQNLLVLLIDR